MAGSTRGLVRGRIFLTRRFFAQTMLDSLFTKPHTRLRHCSAPFFEERDRYLEYVNSQGTPLARVRVIASMLLNVVENLELTALANVDPKGIAEAQRRWAEKSAWHQKTRIRCDSESFLLTAKAWLRFHNALQGAPVPATPYGSLLADYLRFIAGPRGFVPSSVDRARSRTFKFLKWMVTRRPELRDITCDDVVAYVASLGEDGLKPRSIALDCHNLRNLFRFIESSGLISRPISSSIAVPSIQRYDPLPKGPRWSEVRRMLLAKPGSSPAAVRSHAVLMAFAIYGLRSIEVSSLRLESFDWTERVVTIRRAKSGRTQRFPIPLQMAESLTRYLEDARPQCECQNFFVTLKPPFRPMSNSSLRSIVGKNLKRLRIRSAIYSTHALRHACATELLRKDVPFEEIARFLGHRNNRAIGIYAKSSKASLREVANVSLEFLDEA